MRRSGFRNSGDYGTALIAAVEDEEEKVKIVKLLLAAGANADEKALVTAEEKWHEDIVELLLAAGAKDPTEGTETSE